MDRRAVACGVAEWYAGDVDLAVAVVALADGVVAVLRGMEEVAFRVLAECQEESEEAAIGWSKDRGVWCVVCPGRSAVNVVKCRVAEELHLFDGFESALAKQAGVRVEEREETLAEFVGSGA